MQPSRCGLNTASEHLLVLVRLWPSAVRPQFHHPSRRVPAPPLGRPAPQRRRQAVGKVAARSAEQAADRELTAWFEKAAAENPLPTETSFGKLGLPQELVTALERRDIRTAFPIQAATLPDGLAGRDVLGRAQTGSGKTLAFGLPMLARLAGRKPAPDSPRAAWCSSRPASSRVQVRDALEPLGHALGVKTVAVFGGAPLGRQIDHARARRRHRRRHARAACST